MNVGPVEERFARLFTLLMENHVYKVDGDLQVVREVLPDGRVRMGSYHPHGVRGDAQLIVEPAGLTRLGSEP